MDPTVYQHAIRIQIGGCATKSRATVSATVAKPKIKIDRAFAHFVNTDQGSRYANAEEPNKVTFAKKLFLSPVPLLVRGFSCPQAHRR